MSRAIRLTAVLTHPVQYLSPWFRHVASQCPELELTVLYVIRPTPEQQGVGFGQAFAWDLPLVEGYDCRFLRPARPGDRLESGSFSGLDAPGIGREIAATRPQVALVPGWHKAALLRALRACRRLRIPALYRGDSTLATAPPGWRRPLWRARSRLLLAHYSAYLATGQRAREYLLSLGRPESRIFPSPHCVDNDFFAAQAAPHQGTAGRDAARRALGLDPGGFVVLFAGKLVAHKRPFDLIRAVARLGDGDRDGGGATLLVAGSGQLAEACRAEAGRLGVRAAWAGFLNQPELARAYAAADCLVLPSAVETWGLVVNEAQATGLPAVVSAGAGCAPDLITPGETGEVFAAGDVSALAAAIGRLRSALRAGHDFAPACRARAASCSFAAATAGLLEACAAVARPGPLRGRGESPIQTSHPAAADAISHAARRGAPRPAPPRVLACCGGMVIVSGLERLTFEVLRTLREQGAAVHCIVNSWENQRIVPLAEAIGATWSIGSYREDFDRHTRSPVKIARMAWDVTLTSAGLLRDAWRFRPTSVLCPELGSVLRSAPALLCLRALGVPVVLRVGNAPEAGPFYARLWRHVLSRLVTRVAANSAFGVRRLLDAGVPASKVELIPNIVAGRGAAPRDAEVVARARSRSTILCVGQIAPFKGTHLAVEAVLALLAEGWEVQGIIVGRVPAWPPEYAAYAAALMERVRAAGREERIHFAGEREDVLGIMAASYLLVAPILQQETFGNVVLEAKSAGLPAVVFPSGGLVELVEHGVDGFVCSDPSLDALLAGLRHFLASPGARESAGQAARAAFARRAANYGRPGFAARWWRLLAGGREPAPRTGGGPMPA